MLILHQKKKKKKSWTILQVSELQVRWFVDSRVIVDIVADSLILLFIGSISSLSRRTEKIKIKLRIQKKKINKK